MNRIAVLLIIVSTIAPSSAYATLQVRDSLVFGGHKYVIYQVPMLGYWDYGEESAGTGTKPPPPFDVVSSNNWTGYKATWEIVGGELFLTKIKGRIGGSSVKNEEIIDDYAFPAIADWFTGRIYLPVGDQDRKSGEYRAVIVFHIEKGKVEKMSFLESERLVDSWNGLEESAAEPQLAKPRQNVPETGR